MLTLATFRDMFPEFQAVGDALIELALADTAGRIAPGIYLEQTNRAHGLLTAHEMTASSPWGASARLDPKLFPGQTTYSRSLARIQSERCAFRGIT